MNVSMKIMALAVISGSALLVSTASNAWWDDDNDYWDGPWGYPGYGYGGYPGYGYGGYPGYGYGGYPGYGYGGGYPGYGYGGYPGYGYGGYPGYGGWGGGAPQVIYTQPRQSNPAPRPVIE